LFKQYVFNICKCRNRWAHATCFDQFVDIRQNGKTNVAIKCSKCNYTYKFRYPYNGKYLQMLDNIDILLKHGSTVFCGLLIVAFIYSCLTSFGALTFIQVLGIDKSFVLLRHTNFAISALCLPILPVACITGRFIDWEKFLLQKITKMNHLIDNTNNTNTQYADDDMHDENHYYENEQANDDFDDDDDDKMEKGVDKTRRIIGGLLLPTIAVGLDKLFLRPLGLICSPWIRVSITGLIYIGVKKIIKLVYRRQLLLKNKNWFVENYDEKIFNTML